MINWYRCNVDKEWMQLFSDATEMAQCIERSKMISENSGYDKETNILWFYDKKKDIHYFTRWVD